MVELIAIAFQGPNRPQRHEPQDKERCFWLRRGVASFKPLEALPITLDFVLHLTCVERVFVSVSALVELAGVSSVPVPIGVSAGFVCFSFPSCEWSENFSSLTSHAEHSADAVILHMWSYALDEVEA